MKGEKRIYFILTLLLTIPIVFGATTPAAVENGYHDPLYTNFIVQANTSESALVVNQSTLELDNAAVSLQSNAGNLRLLSTNGVVIPNTVTLNGYQVTGFDNAYSPLLNVGNANTLPTQRAVQVAFTNLNNSIYNTITNLNTTLINNITQVDNDDIEGSGDIGTIPVFNASQELTTSHIESYVSGNSVAMDLRGGVNGVGTGVIFVDQVTGPPGSFLSMETADIYGLSVSELLLPGAGVIGDLKNNGTELLFEPSVLNASLATAYSIKEALGIVEGRLNTTISDLNTTLINNITQVDNDDIEGSGTTGRIPIFTGSQEIGSSEIFLNGTAYQSPYRIIAPRFVDENDPNYFMNPSGVSEIDDVYIDSTFANAVIVDNHYAGGTGGGTIDLSVGTGVSPYAILEVDDPGQGWPGPNTIIQGGEITSGRLDLRDDVIAERLVSNSDNSFYLKPDSTLILNQVDTQGITLRGYYVDTIDDTAAGILSGGFSNELSTQSAIHDAIQAEKQDLDEVLSQGNDAGGQQIRNVGAPSVLGDAATVAYVLNNEEHAGTICSAGEYLDGDGSCQSVPSGGGDAFVSGGDLCYETDPIPLCDATQITCPADVYEEDIPYGNTCSAYFSLTPSQRDLWCQTECDGITAKTRGGGGTICQGNNNAICSNSPHVVYYDTGDYVSCTNQPGGALIQCDCEVLSDTDYWDEDTTTSTETRCLTGS